MFHAPETTVRLLALAEHLETNVSPRDFDICRANHCIVAHGIEVGLIQVNSEDWSSENIGHIREQLGMGGSDFDVMYHGKFSWQYGVDRHEITPKIAADYLKRVAYLHQRPYRPEPAVLTPAAAL